MENQKESTKGETSLAFPIHPPLVISVFLAVVGAYGLRYYVSSLDMVETADPYHPILRAVIDYAGNPICLIIFGAFLALIIYLLVQAAGLYAERVILTRLVEGVFYDYTSDEWYLKADLRVRFPIKMAKTLAGRKIEDLKSVFDNTLGLSNRSLTRHSEMNPLIDRFLELFRARLTEDLYFLGFGVWLLPVLGFIGTVIGISRAIGGLERVVREAGAGQEFVDNLQDSMGQVLEGLSTAFDTTFLGLFFAVWIMFSTMAIRRMIYKQVMNAYFLLTDRFSDIDRKEVIEPRSSTEGEE